MSKPINPIKKRKVKAALLEGKSCKQAVLDAGYRPATAINATRLSVVKHCLEEIEAQFKASELTPEMIIQQLQATRQLAIEKKDYATAAYCSTMLGKHLAMFTDKAKIETEEIHSDEYNRLRKGITLTSASEN